jgi:glycosyltransferase involved in cell wall biosynthesis
MPFILLFGLLVIVIWLKRLSSLRASGNRLALLSSASCKKLDNFPRLTVLVAAKEEEDNIAECLQSLLKQNYPTLQIVAIDDRSQDGTLAILNRIQEEAGVKLNVVCVKELPAGWTGKNHALHQGTRVASGDWLCFTDADCRLMSANTMSIAMTEAIDRNIDILSIFPILDAPSWWERIVQPVSCLALMQRARISHVNDPNHSASYSTGQFLLIRRSSYERIGGHQRVRDKLNEDFHFARIAKSMGLRLRLVENEGLLRCRMYTSLRKFWNGWSRIYYGCGGSVGQLCKTIAFMAVLSFLPWLGLGLTVLLSQTAEAKVWFLISLGVWSCAIAVQQFTLWQLYKRMRVEALCSLLYVPALLVVLTILMNAMLKSLGLTKTVWRGTSYRAAVARE